MYSVTKSAGIVLAICATGLTVRTLNQPALAASPPELRVCADPDNLPYSNRRQEGFENELARMIAHDFGQELSYTWLPQRGAFFGKTLDADLCDVVMSVPAGMKDVSMTDPYYRSTYVFVSLRTRNLHIHSLEDPKLGRLRIGVQILGDSGRELPPVQALIRRGVVNNLIGYNIFGNLSETNPQANLVRAVERGEVDIAVEWGPIAEYFARHSPAPLTVDAIYPDPANPSLPLAFDIGIGVRPADLELKQKLNAELVSRRPQIRRLLETFGISRQAVPAAYRERY